MPALSAISDMVTEAMPRSAARAAVVESTASRTSRRCVSMVPLQSFGIRLEPYPNLSVLSACRSTQSPAVPLAWLGRSSYDPRVTRGEVQLTLSAHPSELKALGVRSLEIFGSVARGDAGPGSDVDLLVEFDRPIGLFHFFRVQRTLEQLLGCRVDLVMRDAVKPQ